MTGPVPQRERISEAEYRQLRAAGYSDAEIRQAADVEGPSLDPALQRGQAADASRAIPMSQYDRTPGVGKAAALGAVQGATLNFGDEALGGVGALLDRNQGESLSDAYVRHRNAVRADMAGASAAHPVASAAGTLAGGFMVPGARALGAIGEGATAGQKIGQGVIAGGVLGAGYGAGSVEGSDPNGVAGLGDLAKGTAVGGATGAVLGGVVGGLPLIGRALGITTESGRNDAALKAIRGAIERSGQNVDDVAARLQGMIEAGQQPTLMDALGPAAKDLLDNLAPVGDDAAGTLAREANRYSGDLQKAMQAAAKRRPAGGDGVPMSRLGLVTRAATVGSRHAASREAEATLSSLLARGQGPLPAPPAPATPTSGAFVRYPRAPGPRVSTRTDGAWGPQLVPDTPPPMTPLDAPPGVEIPLPRPGDVGMPAQTARNIASATGGMGRPMPSSAAALLKAPEGQAMLKQLAERQAILPDGSRGWGPGLSGRGYAGEDAVNRAVHEAAAANPNQSLEELLRRSLTEGPLARPKGETAGGILAAVLAAEKWKRDHR